jgi:hypothetical protein
MHSMTLWYLLVICGKKSIEYQIVLFAVKKLLINMHSWVWWWILGVTHATRHILYELHFTMSIIINGLISWQQRKASSSKLDADLLWFHIITGPICFSFMSYMIPDETGVVVLLSSILWDILKTKYNSFFIIVIYNVLDDILNKSRYHL